MVAVVAPTFDLGNTLARVAQIQGFRSQNRLAELQLTQAEQQAADRAQLAQITGAEGFDITDPNSINQLARLGQPGMAFAGQAMNLQAALAQLDVSQLQQAVTRGQLVNNTARNIIAMSGGDPNKAQQAAFLAFKDPTLRQMFPNVHPDEMDPNELLSQVVEAEQQSRIFNDPVALREIVSGQAAIDIGLQPGTVAQVETDPLTGQQDVDILQQPPKAGLQVDIGPDGTVSFSQGGPVAGELTKPSINRLQQSITDSDNQLASLHQIGATFDPSFQTVQGRFQAGKTALKEKVGFSISQAEAQQLDEFSTFKRNAIEGLNRYIKLITGAQMSEAEANRLRRGFPDPGEGLFDGDSPTEFQAKYNATMRQLQLTRARAQWALSNNLISPDIAGPRMGEDLERIVTLDAFQANIDNRANELFDQNRDRGMNDETAWQQARIQAASEFGLQL